MTASAEPLLCSHVCKPQRKREIYIFSELINSWKQQTENEAGCAFGILRQMKGKWKILAARRQQQVKRETFVTTKCSNSASNSRTISLAINYYVVTQGSLKTSRGRATHSYALTAKIPLFAILAELAYVRKRWNSRTKLNMLKMCKVRKCALIL